MKNKLSCCYFLLQHTKHTGSTLNTCEAYQNRQKWLFSLTHSHRATVEHLFSSRRKTARGTCSPTHHYMTHTHTNTHTNTQTHTHRLTQTCTHTDRHTSTQLVEGARILHTTTDAGFVYNRQTKKHIQPQRALAGLSNPHLYNPNAIHKTIPRKYRHLKSNLSVEGETGGSKVRPYH